MNRLLHTGLALVLLAASWLAQQPIVPSPEAVLGFRPGADRQLADYDQVADYFRRLTAASDRVALKTLGQTTEGLPFVMAVISAPQNLARLEEIRQDHLRLTDPRTLSAAEAAPLIAGARTIVLLNASIHSVELGPTQSTMEIAHFLATTTDPAWLKVLDDVVLLMTPCHNPDGYNRQVRWYRRWVGTPYESCSLPELYHRYAGHDNNRDWFMFTQQESRLTVEQIHAPWRPQIVLDMHQMGEDGARMFVPPYQDPIEPNVAPLLVAAIKNLGGAIRRDLLDRGCTGVVSNTLFDAWSPSRAYVHYHGGVRILTEIASCRQASPVERPPSRASETRPTETNPVPWSGRRWTLGDIVHYNTEAAFAALRHASAHREQWARDFHQVFQNACAEDPVTAGFVVGAHQPSTAALAKLLDILALGGLEVRVFGRPTVIPVGSTATDPWPADGDYFIPSSQPYFPFARALLEATPYPEIRERPDGPIRRPYDVTAHDLALLLDLDVRRAAPSRRGAYLAGSAAIGDLPARATQVRKEAENGPDVVLQGVRAARAAAVKNPGRFAIYQPWTASMDEGWTRFFFDSFQIPFHTLTRQDILRCAEAESRPTSAPQVKFQVLLLPDISPRVIMDGAQSKTTPPEWRGGIGEEGASWIESWVKAGGTLVALKDSTTFAINRFRLPVHDALADRPAGEVSIPGSILQLDIEPGIATRWGLPHAQLPAFFDAGKAFENDAIERAVSTPAETIASWSPSDRLLLAGFARGKEHVASHPAVMRFSVGRGQIYLFGFSPQFRFQTWATFPLLLGALAGDG